MFMRVLLLVDMYSKCGSLEDANQVFDSMQVKSTATWNSMITSLGVHGRGEEALDLFAKVEMESLLWVFYVLVYAQIMWLRVGGTSNI